MHLACKREYEQEQCVTHGRKIVLSLKNRKDLPIGENNKNGSPMAKRREEEEYFFKKKEGVSQMKTGWPRFNGCDTNHPNNNFCRSHIAYAVGGDLEDQVLGGFRHLRKHDSALQETKNRACKTW